MVLLFLLFAVAAARYTPDWTSLNTRPNPEWYDDAKFGIFIHWGVFSVPSWAPVGTYAEWYWSDMKQNGGKNPTAAFHNKTYGPNYQYQEFAPHFTAEMFDAKQWMDIIRRSGAKYVVPTSKHHEGFTMWPSRTSRDWNSVDIGPHRDLLGELLDAVSAAGLHRGIYISLYEWFNPLYIGPNPAQYVSEVLTPQLYELAINYKPDLLFADGHWEKPSSFWETPDFLAWLFNDSPVNTTVVINDRWGSETPWHDGGYFTPEYDSKVTLTHKWEENSGVDVHSFGLNRNTPAEQYFSAQYLVHHLLRCVANNGNFLLNIGPSWDGTIPPLMQERLLQIGSFLNVAGEAVYGTRPWRVQDEGPDIDNTTVRYTQKGNIVYAFILFWPTDYKVILKQPHTTNQTSVYMLGYPQSLNWYPLPGPGPYSNKGLVISLAVLAPQKLPNDYAWALKLTNVN